jgi:hypothetical protein
MCLLSHRANQRFGLCRSRLDRARERLGVADNAARVLSGGLDDVPALVHGLGDAERGKGHRAREPNGRVGELEARADAAPEAEAEVPRVLLRGLALRRDEARGLERQRLRVRPRIMQEFPDRV